MSVLQLLRAGAGGWDRALGGKNFSAARHIRVYTKHVHVLQLLHDCSTCSWLYGPKPPAPLPVEAAGPAEADPATPAGPVPPLLPVSSWANRSKSCSRRLGAYWGLRAGGWGLGWGWGPGAGGGGWGLGRGAGGQGRGLGRGGGWGWGRGAGGWGLGGHGPEGGAGAGGWGLGPGTGGLETGLGARGVYGGREGGAGGGLGLGAGGRGLGAGGPGLGGGDWGWAGGLGPCTGAGRAGAGGWDTAATHPRHTRTLRERFSDDPWSTLDPWTPTFKTGTLLLHIREEGSQGFADLLGKSPPQSNLVFFAAKDVENRHAPTVLQLLTVDASWTKWLRHAPNGSNSVMVLGVWLDSCTRKLARY